MRISTLISGRVWPVLLDLRSSGCGMCVCTAAPFEASPSENGVISVWEQGPSSLWCPGDVSITVLSHSWVLLSLEPAITVWWAIGGRWLSQTFLGQGKNNSFGERRWEHVGEISAGQTPQTQMGEAVRLNPRAGVSHQYDAACHPHRKGKDTWAASPH